MALSFAERILKKVGRAGLRRAKPQIPSRTLRRACHFELTVAGPLVSSGQLYIPHYWAVILHDGRKEVRTEGRKFLVWYKDPRHDPRLQAGKTPARYADRGKLRLTPQEFRQELKKGRIIVSQKSRAVKSRPFFGNAPGEGMYGFEQEVGLIVLEEIRKEVAEFTKPVTVRGAIESQARVDL